MLGFKRNKLVVDIKKNEEGGSVDVSDNSPVVSNKLKYRTILNQIADETGNVPGRVKEILDLFIKEIIDAGQSSKKVSFGELGTFRMSGTGNDSAFTAKYSPPAESKDVADPIVEIANNDAQEPSKL